MSNPAPNGPPPADPAPVTPPADPAPTPEAQRRSLEDSLTALDDSTRTFVLGQVKAARTEAQNLRERLKTAEPKAAEFDQQAEKNKSDLQKAQDAATKAEQRATAVERQLNRTSAARAAGLDAEMEQFLTGGTAEEMAEQAKTLAARLGAITAPRLPGPNPAQGGSGTVPNSGAEAGLLAAQRRFGIKPQ